jgi:hypothetical protein
MINVRMIYPIKGADVEEIITLEAAIDAQLELAQEKGFYYTSYRDILRNIVACPTVSFTAEPCSRVVTEHGYQITDVWDGAK